MKKQWSEIDDSHFLYIRIESKLEKNVKEKTEKYPFVIKTVHFSFKKIYVCQNTSYGRLIIQLQLQI